MNCASGRIRSSTTGPSARLPIWDRVGFSLTADTTRRRFLNAKAVSLK